MCKYQLHQQVEAIVESVQPYGVFVRLKDGTRAYIRRRELDLDADVDPTRVVHEGQKITAKVIALGETGKHIELSRRATLPNPWHEFARRFREGEVVRGTVRALHPKGVFVRVEAGIDGFVPLDELATWQVSKPDELLWLDDEVEAIITHLDAHAERLTLSIKARMEQRARATQIVIERTTEPKSVPLVPKDELPPLTAEERERVGQIIVVDDDDGLRNGLVEWLQQRGYRASAARAREELEAQIQSAERGVLLVDIHLGDGDGLELIHDLPINGLHVCVMSSPEWLLERTEEIRLARVFQIFEKPLNEDDIDQFLQRLARGETVQPVWKTLPQREAEKTESRDLNIALRDVAPTQRLQVALERVTQMAHAEKGIVFVQDPVSQAISIVEHVGELPLNQEAFYALRTSPVKDVIVEKEPVFEEHATENKRFDKLRDVLVFESCIGTPIQVAGEVRHALFLFHRQPNAFARARPQYVELDALWLGVLLEEQAVGARLRAISPLLLSGELAMGLAHEVYNKVDALELQLANLVALKHPPTDLSDRLVALHNLARDLKTLTGSFQEMMRAKELSETFNINEVIRRVEVQVRPLARKEGVKIDLRLANNLPLITGNSVALQQVFFNLMLNAVQLMANKRDKYRLLEISTTFDPKRKRPLLIRFADTGPGIHKQLWEKIFELGFSMRGGSGLGLYIARSLIEMFDGKIKVEESVVPLGTTFLIKLPV
jgi:signal transduction histidine kinase/predicted RNA-binding protein with RPS1 domain/ActR/RegA family two-component response regulator